MLRQRHCRCMEDSFLVQGRIEKCKDGLKNARSDWEMQGRLEKKLTIEKKKRTKDEN